MSKGSGPLRAVSGGNANNIGTSTDTQVLFNDAGVVGGDAGLVWDKTNKVLTHTQGTITANHPQDSSTVTWNNAAVTFTDFFRNVTNTASNSASRVADFQVNSATIFNINPAGNVYVKGLLRTNAPGNATTPSVAVNNSNMGWWDNSGVQLNAAVSGATIMSISSSPGVAVGSTGGWLFRNQADPSGGSIDGGWYRNSSKVVEWTDGTQGSYAGTAIKLGAQLVSELPVAAAGTKGSRASVRDATLALLAANIGTAVTGGGANFATVVCDGASWLIG